MVVVRKDAGILSLKLSETNGNTCGHPNTERQSNHRNKTVERQGREREEIDRKTRENIRKRVRENFNTFSTKELQRELSNNREREQNINCLFTLLSRHYPTGMCRQFSYWHFICEEMFIRLLTNEINVNRQFLYNLTIIKQMQ